MNLAYSLNKNIHMEKIANDLKKICSKLSKEDLDNSVLIISIQKINNYQQESLLPKIEYKQLPD